MYRCKESFSLLESCLIFNLWEVGITTDIGRFISLLFSNTQTSVQSISKTSTYKLRLMQQKSNEDSSYLAAEDNLPMWK